MSFPSFQEVQELSALQASLRLLPALIIGTILNLTTGLFVDKLPPLWVVTASSVICAVSPLLMAVAKPDEPYWYNALFAQLLMPVSGDILFTVGLIIVSEVFPDNTQALAGGVFNTASQFGNSLGLAVMQVVSTLTARKATYWASKPADALLSGYRASFWAMFGMMMACFVVGAFGLRRAGNIGVKQD
jgi:nitrate/nitrite transporter NarK